MPITVSWDNDEHTAIRYQVTDPWNWQDLWNALSDDDELIDSVEHTVHLIFDATGSKNVPPDPISKLKGIAELVNPRLGLLVVVGPNTWLHLLTGILYKVYGAKIEGMVGVENVPTLEAARALIAAYPKRQT